MNQNQHTLSIKTISTACGVLPQTIRTWEKRYKAFSPQRSEGGQRLYSEEDLNRAKLIVTLIEKGQTISNLAKLSLEELKQQIKVTLPENTDAATNTSSTIGIKKLLGHLASYDINAVASEMQHLRTSIGAKDFIFKIILPVMNEIGLLVAKGKYSITQEHIISTIVRHQLGQIHLPNVGHDFGNFALATPEGNIHELPILMADIICRSNRLNTSYLGAAHPAECLAEAVNALKCDTIILGTVTSDQWNYDKQIIPYLTKVDHFLKHKVKVILGGGLNKDFPPFENIMDVQLMKTFEELDKTLLAME